MIQADLHVHSKYSRHPSEWFLQKIGASESYVDVEEVYALAKARGMQYVTLTDHNTIDGALELNAGHPEDTFVSLEITTYFPETGCKIHVLAYDVDREDFDEIQKVRTDIYQLRNLLRQRRIPCAVAHPMYAVNGMLTPEILERLIVLFDVFEGINGTRGKFYNQTWVEALEALTEDRLHDLAAKHGLDPWGETSWKKAFIGGSDDHSGLMAGLTYTMAGDGSIAEFMDFIRSGQTAPGGRHGDHKTFAFSVYKIACDFSQSRGTSREQGPINLVNTLLFENGPLGLRHRLAVKKMKKTANSPAITAFLDELAGLRTSGGIWEPDRIERAYDSLTGILDEYFRMIANSLEKDLINGDMGRLLKNLSAMLPALFMVAPFFSSLRHLHRDKNMLKTFRDDIRHSGKRRRKRILWFSDTMTDLNGVSSSLRELGNRAYETGRPVRFVTSLGENEDDTLLPPGTLNLPCIYSVTPQFYTSFTLRVPSLLKSIDIIAHEDPDEIVISTPGPVGLVGLAAARLLDVRCTGIYHTDFARQADFFIGDPAISSIIEVYTRGFFKLADEIRVPTGQYMDMLSQRGFDRNRMKLFKRGIEPSFAVTNRNRQAAVRKTLGIPLDRPVLLWAGRMGKEKNMDFLLDIYRDTAMKRPGVVLLLVGNGPEEERLKAETRDDPNIVFAGRVDRKELPHYYGLADIFVFPSTTDTFGMVVMEAQSCGLPAIVTDVGGPQDIVFRGETGFVIPADDLPAWVEAVVALLDMKRDDPADFADMRARTRKRFRTDYDWDRVLDDVMGVAESESAAKETTARSSREGALALTP